MAQGGNLDSLAKIDSLRLQAGLAHTGHDRAGLGQFFTPAPVARLMASMMTQRTEEIRLLDPGAGIGTLTVALVQECCNRSIKPSKITATLYEIDQRLEFYLQESVRVCHELCSSNQIEFSADICMEDFIAASDELLGGGLFSGALQIPHFNCAILNPPYKKIGVDSLDRKRLKSIGIETTNLYTGFLSIVIKLLDKGGEFVAITPRSFCNGEYFLPFRKFLLNETTIRRIHLFNSRSRPFYDDGVLQESVILHALKQRGSDKSVLVSCSDDAGDEAISLRENKYSEVIDPDDSKCFIHIVTSDTNREFAQIFRQLSCRLSDIGLSVSTGPVVDFRLKQDLLREYASGSVPLLYPLHLERGEIIWPKTSRKPNAIRRTVATEPWLVSNGTYVLVKRFTSKEESKRVTATVYAEELPGDVIGIENHLNYFHQNGKSVDSGLADGLAAFLNSTLVDQYFRQFNGHTQVNASDLKNLSYPSKEQLLELGVRAKKTSTQSELDHEVIDVLKQYSMKKNPVKTIERIKEAEEVLKSLGLPREQQNERSALTLLALLDLKPGAPWSKAANPLRGITPIMEFIHEYYGKRYAPNTRETIRRFSVHQMVDAGLLLQNPDKPDRPVNSPDWAYQVSPAALSLLKGFGLKDWGVRLDEYLSKVGTLKARYDRERNMEKIPLEITPGKLVELSPGGQNTLVDLIWHEFAPRFTPGAKPIYIGDTGDKFAWFDQSSLAALGVRVDIHGKMPDVILHFTKMNWLILVEAVTSHGPINPKRRAELRTIFSDSTAGLVFVTAFLDRKSFTKYASDISWETEVWVADSPSHLIHFDGKRFLGPYPD